MPDEWFYIKDKKKVGPVGFAQLQQLAAGGQIQAGDMVLQGGATRWAAAGTVAGLFGAARAALEPALELLADPLVAAAADPLAAPVGMPPAPDDAFARPEPPPDLEAFAEATASARIRPHQGGLILGLGIASIVCSLLGLLGMCPLLYPFLVFALAAAAFGLPVWFKGGADLRQMRHNLVDPEGEGPTRSGRACGLIGALVGIAELSIAALVILALKIIELTDK